MEKEPLRPKDPSRYRDTYLVGPKKDHIAKIPKEQIDKKYPFGQISYPTAPYTLLKFGTTNINEADMAGYRALPEVVRENFVPATRMIQGVVVQDRVMNYDGTPALSIDRYSRTFGEVRNEEFWNKVEELKNILYGQEHPLLGAFQGENIFVKKISEDIWSPVIIDFKRLGGRSFLFQPNLALPGEVHKKLLRQFEVFERKYRPKDI